MKGLLFTTILLSSAALLTSGDIDVEAAIRREALSHGATDEDLGEPLPFLIVVRRTRQNDGRPLVIVSHVRDPLEKRYSLNRMVMENPMYVDEPGFTDISRTNDNNRRNRIQANDLPISRGKKIPLRWSTNVEKPEQDDQITRMRRREMNDRTLGRRSKRPPIRISGQDFVISKGKRNYLINAEELSKRMALPWNDDGGDGDWALARSLKSREQEDHSARRSTKSKQGLTLRDRMNASILFHMRKGKRTSRPIVFESTGSV